MLTKKKQSQKQEKSVAKVFDAKVTVASGAFWGMKADCRSDKFLIECKTTGKHYYSLTSSVWEKIEREADRDGMRIPLLVVDLRYSVRVVVFNPKYFNTSVFSFKEQHKPQKSYRLTYNRHHELRCECISFSICGKKVNELQYMHIEDFIDAFKEELEIGFEESV